jgi:hypothetical protein
MSSFANNHNSTPDDPNGQKSDVPFRSSLDGCHGAEVGRSAESQNETPRSARGKGGGSFDECEIPPVRDFCHGAEVQDVSRSREQRDSKSARGPIRAAELHQLCLLDLLTPGRDGSGSLLVKAVPATYDSSIQVLDFSELVSMVGRLDSFACGSGGAIVEPSRWAAAFEAIDLSLDPQGDALCRASLADLAVSGIKVRSDDSYGLNVREALLVLVEVRAHLDRLAALGILPFDPDAVGQLDDFLSSAILHAGVRLGARRSSR